MERKEVEDMISQLQETIHGCAQLGIHPRALQHLFDSHRICKSCHVIIVSFSRQFSLFLVAEQAPILPRLRDSCVSAAPAPAAQKQSATAGVGREGGGREGGDGRQQPTQGHRDARYSLRSRHYSPRISRSSILYRSRLKRNRMA